MESRCAACVCLTMGVCIKAPGEARLVSGPSPSWEKIFLGCRLAAGLISRGRVPRPGSDTGRGRSSTHPGCHMRWRLAPAPRTPQAPPALRAEVSTTQRRPEERAWPTFAGQAGGVQCPWSRGNGNGMRGLRGREEEESTGNGRATDDIPRLVSIPDVVSRTYRPFLCEELRRSCPSRG